MNCRFILRNVTVEIFGSYVCSKFSYIMTEYILFIGIKFTHDFSTFYSHDKVWESLIPMEIRGNHS